MRGSPSVYIILPQALAVKEKSSVYAGLIDKAANSWDNRSIMIMLEVWA